MDTQTMIKRMRSFFVMLWVLSVSVPLLAQTSSIITTTANTPINIVLSAPEGLIEPLTFVVDAVPQSGRLTGEAPNLFYIPHQDFVGTDSIAYSIIDANGSVTSATISIIVEAGDETNITLPEASYLTEPETAVSVTLAQGANYAILTGPLHGSLSGQVPNLTYTPDSYFLGTDSFSYQALVDGEVQTFEVTIEVGGQALANFLTSLQAADNEASLLPTLPGVSPELARIVTEGTNIDPGNDLMLAEALVQVTGDVVDVVITATGDIDMATLLIENAGGTVQHVYPPYIVATVSLGHVASLGASEPIANIRLPLTVQIADPDLQPQYGPNTTEGVAASNANAWHTAGQTGAGVKVGVIDLEFDRWQNSDLTGCVVEVRDKWGNAYDGTTSGTDVHGTAVSEIICDMAPGADVYGRAILTDVDFVNAVNYLVDTIGVQTINASIGLPIHSGDGYDLMSLVVNDVVQNDDVVFVISAGNEYESHYEAQLTTTYVNAGDIQGWNMHAFDGSSDYLNFVVDDRYTLPVGIYHCQGLIWNDWSSPFDTNLDLYAFRWNNGNPKIVASSIANNISSGSPYEEVCFLTEYQDAYGYAIRATTVPARTIWLQFFGRYNSWLDLEYTYPYSSNSSPSTALYAFSAAAVDVNSGNIEYYSSSGPANYHMANGDGGLSPFYSTGGNFHPQLSGFANVITSVTDAMGQKFNGTSSAAPHITGAVALVRGAYPFYNHMNVESFLKNKALSSSFGYDPGATGPDTRYGHGYLWLGAPPAPACDIDTVGIYRDSDFSWYLRDSNSAGFAGYVFNYGLPSDRAIIGDWDGDGIDTVGIYRDGVFYLKNANNEGTGLADVTLSFGLATDIPIAGDWDGDGIDTIGLYRPSAAAWYLRNSNTTGGADISFTYGLANETPVTGDWDGDGTDTIGIFRASDNTWYLRDSNSSGFANTLATYGLPSIDIAITGDWNGDCIDTIGLYRHAQGLWFLKNSNSTGVADITFVYGFADEAPVTGDWNND